jgi:hypothetical protein
MKDENYAMIYRMACEELEIRNSIDVAILVTKLPLNWKLNRLKGLLGLVPHKSRNYHLTYISRKPCGNNLYQ